MNITYTFKFTFLYIFFILLTISPSLNAQWIQKGADIDGEAANDRSGWSISMPDENTVAIGAISNDGNGIDAGHVRIYKWTGSSWTQKGADIDGEAAGDDSGFSVSMPDSNTVAISARKNDGTGMDAGHVRVYSWNGTTWVQKGIDLDGEAIDDEFGFSLHMPDSNTLAVGGRQNDASGSDAGHTRIFEWNGNSWTQKGADIDGEAAGDESGFSVRMPNSNTVAIGAYRNDGNGNNSGHTRIYTWNGSAWVQKGGDIDGEAVNDQSGVSIDMPDTNTIAIGAYANSGTAAFAGHARVYFWNGTTWLQKGGDIDGEAASDQSGYCVSMPNANTIAIGAPGNAGNGTASGHARIYRWNGSSWTQLGSDIDGEASLDQSGYFVFMPDSNTIAVGAPNNSGLAQYSGHVRVFDYNLPTSIEKYSSINYNLSIYPNPTKGQFNLETSNSIGEVVQISSISGKVLKEITISQNHEVIDLSGLANGLYFLKIGDLSKKIIKYE